MLATLLNFVFLIYAAILGIALSITGLLIATGNRRIQAEARFANGFFLWVCLVLNAGAALLGV